MPFLDEFYFYMFSIMKNCHTSWNHQKHDCQRSWYLKRQIKWRKTQNTVWVRSWCKVVVKSNWKRKVFSLTKMRIKKRRKSCKAECWWVTCARWVWSWREGENLCRWILSSLVPFSLSFTLPMESSRWSKKAKQKEALTGWEENRKKRSVDSENLWWKEKKHQSLQKKDPRNKKMRM